MILPATTAALGPWAREIITECEVSRADRIAKMAMWYSYYYNGTDGTGIAPYNKIFSHIDRLASFLFSAEDVRFILSYDQDVGEPWLTRATSMSRIFNRNFNRSGCDLDFSDAVHWALVEGKILLKQQWGFSGMEPWLVHPHFFAVLREDIDGLDRQEAFVQTVFITKNELRRQLTDATNKKDLEEAAAATATQRADELRPVDDTLRQIIIGGNTPVRQNSPAPGRSNVLMSNMPGPMLDPKVAADLVRVDELWVIDSARDDYTTIRLVDDIVIEGGLKRRNLSGVKGEHPYTEVCPNRNPNYFWGESEVATLAPLQDMLNESITDLRRLTKLRARPPRVGIGLTGISAEKYRALNVPDGYANEESPAGKMETLTSEVPPELFSQIEKILQWFDEAGGFQPITMGQGEPGVRAGSHATTLLRTGSPRIRDRALLVERQAGVYGDFSFKLLQNKNVEVFKAKKTGEEFILSQAGSDYRMSVDSHSGSPIFADDTERKAFQLHRAGAISAAELILLTRPPQMDALIEGAEKRQAAQEQLVKEHPELLTKGAKKK